MSIHVNSLELSYTLESLSGVVYDESQPWQHRSIVDFYQHYRVRGSSCLLATKSCCRLQVIQDVFRNHRNLRRTTVWSGTVFSVRLAESRTVQKDQICSGPSILGPECSVAMSTLATCHLSQAVKCLEHDDVGGSAFRSA